MEKDFRGIFVPLTSPFRGNQVSQEKFRDNIEKYNSYNLAGYVIAGSTGESVYLTDDENLSLTQTAVKTAVPEKKVIAGTGRESTRSTIELTNRAADLGIDAALICIPHYYKSLMNYEALKKHYITLAEKSRIPIIIYNIPQNTGLSLDPALIIELSKHPNILGMKDSSGNLAFMEEVKPFMPPGSAFLVGAGSVLFPGLIMGASGGILTLAGVAPDLCSKLYELFREKKWDEAEKLQLKLVPLNQAVTKIYGVPGAKYVLDQRGFYGGPCRLPLLPLSREGKAKIDKILDEMELPVL